MTPWRWLSIKTILAVHDQQIQRHGGAAGVRDQGLLESAIARPLNLASYGEPDAAELAASYSYGIARNHPFVDGNKRTAFVAGALFLDKNGFALSFHEPDVVLMVLRLAAGEMTEQQLASWFRENMHTDLHDEAAEFVAKPGNKRKAKIKKAKTKTAKTKKTKPKKKT